MISTARRMRWTRTLSQRLDLPMAALSLVFLVAFIGTFATAKDSPWPLRCERTVNVIWILFIVEFVIKLAVAPRRAMFLRRNWFDLLVIALPMLRILRLARFARAARGAGALLPFTAKGGASLFRVGLVIRRTLAALEGFLKVSRAAYVGLWTLLVVAGSAAVVLWFEKHAVGSSIQSYGDALWWSATNVTTVACDLNPVTLGGRVIAVGIMVYGVAVFGYFVSCAVMFIQGAGQMSGGKACSVSTAGPE